MDHFNATVQNGALVSTRRGLQVTKTKHQGMRFVNSFAAAPAERPAKQPRSSKDEPAIVNLGKPLETRFKFVTKPRPKPKTKDKQRSASTSSNPTKSSTKDHEDEQARRQGKLQTRRGTAPAVISGSSNSQLVPRTPSGDLSTLSSISTWLPKNWRSYNVADAVQFDGREKSRELIHLYFNIVPTKMYPLEELLEYNPLRQHGFFDRVHRDLVTMHCVVMSASLIDSILIRGERCSTDMSYSISRVCNMVNGKLQDRSGQIQQPLLECVVAMAICGTYIGRHDHWHVHMKGLRQMLKVSGGLRKDMGYCLNKVRRGDVKGAAAIGALPYLDYPRFFDPISDKLPPETRSALDADVAAVLGPCGIQPRIVASTASLARFARIVTRARNDPTRSIRFDPDSFIEEWYWVEYQLVRYPGALRDESSLPLDTAGLPAAGGEFPTAPQVEPSFLTAEFTSPLFKHGSFVASPALRPTPADNLLEPAVRLAGILYVEELIPDEPRSLNAFSVLLSLLNYQVRAILDVLCQREKRASTAFDGYQEPGDAVAATVDDLMGEEDAQEEAAAGFCTAVEPDGLPTSLAAIRPVMIWVCLVGYAIARAADKQAAFWGSESHDRATYREGLALLVGPRPEHVDRLVDTDFEMLRVLGLDQLHLRDGDDRARMKSILREHILGQQYVTPPITP